jgi:hypothetical protein
MTVHLASDNRLSIPRIEALTGREVVLDTAKHKFTLAATDS